jgi:hypothetical protein
MNIAGLQGGGMASEKVMWEHMRDRVGELMLMERITEKLNEGVPDVSWCHGETDTAGWLELKVLDKPAKTLMTEKRWVIPFKSPAQPLWLYRWAKNGGRAGVLLRTSDDMWIFWRAEGTVEWLKMIQSAEAFDVRNITNRTNPFSPHVLVYWLSQVVGEMSFE